MGEAKRRRNASRRPQQAQPISFEKASGLPIADEGEITSTTLYPTMAAAFAEEIATKPWFEKYSPETRRMMKFVFVTAVAEMMRTVVFRIHAEDNGAVFDDLNKEIEAYDAEMRRQRDEYAAELH
jgi:hypothetical protein